MEEADMQRAPIPIRADPQSIDVQLNALASNPFMD
jgi:hypothetical protein